MQHFIRIIWLAIIIFAIILSGISAVSYYETNDYGMSALMAVLLVLNVMNLTKYLDRS